MQNTEGLQKAKELFPIGEKVKWGGAFFSGFYRDQLGTVIDHYIKKENSKFVWVVINTEFGEKEFIVVDCSDENYEVGKDLQLLD